MKGEWNQSRSLPLVEHDLQRAHHRKHNTSPTRSMGSFRVRGFLRLEIVPTQQCAEHATAAR